MLNNKDLSLYYIIVVSGRNSRYQVIEMYTEIWELWLSFHPKHLFWNNAIFFSVEMYILSHVFKHFFRPSALLLFNTLLLQVNDL